MEQNLQEIIRRLSEQLELQAEELLVHSELLGLQAEELLSQSEQLSLQAEEQLALQAKELIFLRSRVVELEGLLKQDSSNSSKRIFK